jgi:hypothetical protein
MKKVYYEKVGRRYVPVAEYDSDFYSSFCKGAHLVISYPGGQSTRYNIDPAYAPMIAAGRIAEETITKAIVEASEIQQNKNITTPLTPAQHAAWRNLIKEFGESASRLQWPSAADIARKAANAMQEEAVKILKHPAAQESFNEFLTICNLIKDQNE